MTSIRHAVPSDFDAIAAIIESSYLPHDPSGSMPGRHPAALGGAPFTWWGEPTLSWWVAEEAERPVAFALWRRQQRNTHLHSLFVAADAQRRGIGGELLRFHFDQARAENPTLASLTLHVRVEARWAQALYARHGCVVRDPRAVPLDEDSGLGDWVRTYPRFGWPEEGKLLMGRAV